MTATIETVPTGHTGHTRATAPRTAASGQRTATVRPAPPRSAPARTAPARGGRPAAPAGRPVARRRGVGVTVPSCVTSTSVRVEAPRPVAVEPVAASSAVQLTRRGWVVLVALAVAVAAVLVGLAALSHGGAGDTRAAAAAPVAAPVAAGQVVVQPGDTLWTIAERVAPGRDPRAVVYDLRQANHLADSTVVEGQVLRVG